MKKKLSIGKVFELHLNMNFYLQRYGFQGPFIETSPHPTLNLIIVIPCFNETDLIGSLLDLYHAQLPKNAVEVIVVINAGETTDIAIKAQNESTYHAVKKWISHHQKEGFVVHVLLKNDLPKKHAGVGLARKIGMDEAVYRFELLERDGIIVCFDADSKCDSNYLTALEDHFEQHAKTPGCSVYFEHPLEGDDFPDEVYQGIINYELHLRYYNQALKFCGLPYAFHTVGSSMAVRSSAYQKQGGMNKRKAGEDFYFLHKIIELGNFTELKSSCVIPSPRISDRVPFGTGKAIGDWVAKNSTAYFTYNFESFQLIQCFVAIIPRLYREELVAIEFLKNEDHKSALFAYLTAQKFEIALAEIRGNSKTKEAFIKRFFKWFDAFQVLKLVHFLRDNTVGNSRIEVATSQFLSTIGLISIPEKNIDQLLLMRIIEKK